MSTRPLGEILLEMGAVDALQIRAALAHHQKWGVPLGRALTDLRFCSEEDVARALAMQTALPLVDLDAQPLNPKLLFTVPVKTAERFGVVPLRLEGKRAEVLVIAAKAPASMATLDAVKAVSGKSRVVAQIARDAAVDRAIGFLYYGKPREETKAALVPFRDVKIETEATFEEELSAPSEESSPVPELQRTSEHGVEAPEPEPEPESEPTRSASDELDGLLGEAVAGTARPTPAAQPPPVLLVGWHDARAKALAAMLKLGGVESRLLADEALEGCAEGDVLIASTLSLQVLLPAGTRIPRGKLIICGMTEDADVQDARALGARMYLRPPFSPEQLARAVRQVQTR